MTWFFRKKRKPPNPILVGTPSINIIKQAEANYTPPPTRNNQAAPTTITTTKHGGGILIKVEITITGKS